MEAKTANMRKQKDIMRLMLSNHEIELVDMNASDFYVKFHGPKESPYEGVNQLSLVCVGRLESPCLHS